jgi:hypothetical protein
MRFREGEQVTILPPYTDDPVIIEHQHHAVIAARTDGGYMVDGLATWPLNQRFGPFPPHRLVSGWKDENGRWRA